MKCFATPVSPDQKIQQFEPFIGGFPPNIESNETLVQIKTEYESVKNQLDLMIKKSPRDYHLLYLRGHLQSMGHNINIDGAWSGANSDLILMLNKEPKNVPALLELAELWVNSRPDLANKAEKLFHEAQCYSGPNPLEEAQNGLFFALYYQGKMLEAYEQAVFLHQTWATNPRYGSFVTMTSNNLKKNKPDMALPEPMISDIYKSKIVSCRK